MATPLFTPEELAELAAADALIDETFVLTKEEAALSRKLDRAAVIANMDPERRKRAEYDAAYRKANKDKISEYKRAWERRNREKRNALRRERRAREEEAECGVSV